VGEREFTPEQFAEQIRQLKVADILLSTVSTLGQLAYVKLDAKQLGEARLAIDGIAALLPTLEGHTDAQTLRDFNQLLANVRLAYASGTDIAGVQDAGHVPDGEGAPSSAGAADAAANADAPVPDASAIQDAGPVSDSEGGQATDTPSEPIQ
jgi:hypothetical protein